jgi:hypothetical protein
MPTFQDRIHSYFDSRVSTLGRIKSRSLGADSLTLTALNVLVYAQLEGGIKDLVSCVLRDLNIRHPPMGEIKPDIVQWRNPDEINRFKAMVDFHMIAKPAPFSAALTKRFRVRGINRRSELNQMSWDAIRRVYKGLGLDYSGVQLFGAKIDQIVNDRNEAAHHGTLPSIAATYMEQQVRDNAMVVEKVLTDFSLRILPFFEDRLHTR